MTLCAQARGVESARSSAKCWVWRYDACGRWHGTCAPPQSTQSDW